MRPNTIKYLSLSGIIGAILFTSVSLSCGIIKDGYNPIHNFISELGATNSSTELLMNSLGFISSGLLFCLFGCSLLALVSKNISSKIGALLIIIFGVGMTLAGIFSCDTGCPPNGSMESIIHDRVSAVTFISVITGIILLGFTLKKMYIFQSFSKYLTWTGFISLLLLVVMVNSFESRYLTGLWQRLLLLTIFIWASLVGLKIFKNFDKLK